MRKCNIILACLIALGSAVNSQTGPGGIGNSSNLQLWLNASELGLSNSDPVSSWDDLSGNENDAAQNNSSNQPIYLENQINSNPAVSFDGNNDRLTFGSDIVASAVTIFTVVNPISTAYQSILATANHHISYGTSTLRAEYPSGKREISRSLGYRINSISTSSESVAPTDIRMTNGASTTTLSRTGFYSLSNNAIGSLFYNGSYRFPFSGQMAEIIIYDEVLNTAQQNIVSNYLSSKYDLTCEFDLFAYDVTYGNNVIGIGQETDGSQLDSRGQDSLEISNPSTLGDGDYLLVGNNGNGYASSLQVGTDASARWSQVWRTSITGTPGTVDLTFYLGTNDFASDANNYVVYIESLDGDFSNGGTSIQETGRVYDAVNKTVSFTGISLNNGDYFTLAEKTGVVATEFGQPGPGGVGAASNLELWLNASSLSLSNSDPVSSWTDLSGNGRNATQNTASNQPIYLSNILNGNPVLNFDGSNDRFELSNNINSTAITIFTVVNPTTSAYKSIMTLDKHHISYGSSRIRAEFPTGSIKRNKSIGFSISSFSTSSESSSSTPVSIYDGSSNTITNRTGFYSLTNNSIGSLFYNNAYDFQFQGQMAEIIIFNEQLNSAKRRIVSNYLGAKYNLTPEVDLYAYESTHSNDLIGIGQESDGSHEASRGTDSLEIINPSSLDDGDYLLTANDGGDFNTSNSVPTGVTERWNRVWRAGVTGTPGTVDLRFYLGSSSFASPTDYIIISETNDGDFSNGDAAILATSPTFSINGYVEFTGVTLSDGMYFTLAEMNNESTVQNGDWDDANTWACACIPGSTENAIILHDVDLDGNASVLDLTISSSGSLTFSTNETLSIHGDMLVEGLFVSATGTVEAVSTGSQTFNNSSSSNLEFYNLIVNNNSGLDVNSGGWAIKNNLQVTAGGMDVSLADSVVLYSGSGGTSQILESMSGAFTGDFVVQRYISTRRTDYSNHSSPISNATIADLDDDLFLSGVGGNNGDVQTSGGSTFRSVFRYDSPTDSYVPLTSTATALSQGVGYEIYLATNVNQFAADTLDYVGTPTSGSITVQVDQGWNLVGNPYHSFIDYDELTSTGLSANYYIFNTANGSYSALTGADHIAPGQGFWVEKLSAGTVDLTFDENDKVNSTSSSFLRNKNSIKDLTLSLTSLTNNFKHEMKVKFDPISSNKLDENDASYLASPIDEAPAIYAKPLGMSKNLVINSLSSWDESHTIPIEIYTGVDGKYNLASANLDHIYDNYDCVYLYDKEESMSIDLSVESNYEFYSSKGTHGRFDLIVSNSSVSCYNLVDHNNVSQNIESRINLRNSFGDWYLDYEYDNEDIHQLEVNIFNMKGQQMIAPKNINISGNGNFKIEGLDQLNGIYLIHIKSNNKVFSKTISL